MLYGRYADGSVWAPRGDGPRLLEDMDEVLEEYVRNIFRAYGREYSPSEDRIPAPPPSGDTGRMDVRLHPDTPFLWYGRTGHGASRGSGGGGVRDVDGRCRDPVTRLLTCRPL